MTVTTESEDVQSKFENVHELKVYGHYVCTLINPSSSGIVLLL